MERLAVREKRKLLIQAHGWALVHAHVGIAQQASGLALDALRIQSVQFLWGHFQVGFHFWTRGHLGDIETVLPSWKDMRCISKAVSTSHSEVLWLKTSTKKKSSLWVTKCSYECNWSKYIDCLKNEATKLTSLIMHYSTKRWQIIKVIN